MKTLIGLNYASCDLEKCQQLFGFTIAVEELPNRIESSRVVFAVAALGHLTIDLLRVLSFTPGVVVRHKKKDTGQG